MAAALRAMQPEILGAPAGQLPREGPAFLRDPYVLVPAATGTSDRSALRRTYARPLLTVFVVVALVLLKEPPRGASDPRADMVTERVPFGIALRDFWRDPVLRWAALAAGASAFIGSGTLNFITPEKVAAAPKK